MNTKVALGAATAALAIGVGFSEPASALTFKVNAQHVNPATSLSFNTTLIGTFDFVGGVYDNIELKSTLTGKTYNSLFLGDPEAVSTDTTAYFKDPFSDYPGLKLTFASALSSAQLGDTISLVAGRSLESLELNGSSFFVIEKGDATAVPTPALLPGLIGLGVAALRRKDEESAEENA